MSTTVIDRVDALRGRSLADLAADYDRACRVAIELAGRQ